MPDQYDSLRKFELLDAVEHRGLDDIGTRMELIARLRANDATRLSPPEASAPVATAPPAESGPEPTPQAPPPPTPPPVEDRLLGRRPSDRGPKPWDALQTEVFETLREQASDLWRDGQEQTQFLARIAEDVAREKWRALTSKTTPEKQRAESNLRHLQAQIAGRVARVKMHLVERGDSVLVKVIKSAVRVISSAVVAAAL